MDKLSALPPLARLRAFEAAARLESFTVAADELHLTQTAVSKQIAALEEYLGVSLFERRNRAVFLTEEGRRLGRVVSVALSDIALEAARLRGATPSNELVLHCQLCEAFYWLMPRLSRFHERHPSLELRVISASAPLSEASEPFDIALQTSGRAAGTAQLAFSADDEVFPVASPDLIAGRTLPMSIAELNDLVRLVHRVTPQAWMDWDAWFAALSVKADAARRTMAFDSFPLVLQAAVAGQGVALGWRRSVEGMIAEGKLVRLCEESVHRADELSVYRGRRSDKEEAIEALLSWLRDELD